MAAKFTPAPREVLDGRRVGVTLPSRVEGCGFDSHCIALTYSDRDDINAEANARLIAAAPCLLDAAKSIDRLAAIIEEQHKCMRERVALGWVAAGEDGCFGIAVKTDSAALRWQALDQERAALIAAARAAIAKATGEGA